MGRLDMRLYHKSNYQAIRELNGLLKDNSELRYKIIFFDTLLGAYNLQKNYKNKLDFRRRTITSQIYEAKGISEQRRETLNSLKNGKPNEILKNISEKASKILEDKNIEKSYLYDLLLKFIKSDNLINAAGKRLEIRLSNGQEITQDTKDWEIEKIFGIEATRMIGALGYELDEIKREY